MGRPHDGVQRLPVQGRRARTAFRALVRPNVVIDALGRARVRVPVHATPHVVVIGILFVPLFVLYVCETL